MVDKESMRESFLQGYEMGKHVEELDDMSVRAANTEFENWFEINIE